MTLNGEDKGDEYIVSKDKHVTKLLADDIPSCKHFRLIPGVVKYIYSS